MKLNTYLSRHRMSVEEFAIKCRVSLPVIYRALKNVNVSPRTAKRIKTVTKGDVEYKHIQTFHGAV